MSRLIDLDAIRAAHPLPGVVGADVKLLRAGREWKACCPFHADRTPSFTIFDGGQRWHCFGGCGGGDVLDYIQRRHDVSLREAAGMLDGGSLPSAPVPPRPHEPEPERDTVAEARAIWRSAGPIQGTAAEAYLRGRGITCPLPDSLRFAVLPYGRRELPCLVALLANVENRAAGIQRTFVRADGSGKADVPAPKLSLGQVSGAAIRLAPAASRLTITGGLEDGLTLLQETGRVIWCATGEGSMARVALPSGVREVVIGADNGPAGEAHADRAVQAHVAAGRLVSVLRPLPAFADFNAELQGLMA